MIVFLQIKWNCKALPRIFCLPLSPPTSNLFSLLTIHKASYWISDLKGNWIMVGDNNAQAFMQIFFLRLEWVLFGQYVNGRIYWWRSKKHLFISQQMFCNSHIHTQEYSLDSNNFLPFHDLTLKPPSSALG